MNSLFIPFCSDKPNSHVPLYYRHVTMKGGSKPRLKPLFLTTMQWHVSVIWHAELWLWRELVFKGRAHECPAVTLRLRHLILDFCMTTGSKNCCLFSAVVFLYTMSCKEEFDEKLIDYVRSFPVIHDLSKKSYKDKIAKDNAWKSIATALECDGKFNV